MPLMTLFLAAALPAADPNSLANPQVVQPKHVALDLTVSFDEKTIRGRAELAVAYPQGEAKASTLDLDTRDLRIESVTDGAGKPLTFALEPRGAAPRPAAAHHVAPAAAERSASRTRRARRPPRSSGWSRAQTTSGKRPFLFTQSQAIHARSWMPCMDSPGVRRHLRRRRARAGRGSRPS